MAKKKGNKRLGVCSKRCKGKSTGARGKCQSRCLKGKKRGKK